MISLAPIFEKMSQDRFNRSFEEKESPNGVAAKVQGFVQRKIAGGLGSLFVSVAAPLFLPNIRSTLRDSVRFKKKPQSFLRPDALWSDEDAVPLGLMDCGLYSWMNAVMQIALRLPVFRTILLLWAPQSYEPFQRFIDQYDADRRARLEISAAATPELIRCLAEKMSTEVFSVHGNPDLFEIFRTLLLSCTSKESIPLGVHSKEESCCLIEWDAEALSFPSLIHKKLKGHAPCHLLVFVKNKADLKTVSIPKQIVDEGEQYYDLQGFIEKRQDVGLTEFIAYVKAVGKNWYQCRNQRISKLQSIHLHIPLLSGHLFYYKRCP